MAETDSDLSIGTIHPRENFEFFGNSNAEEVLFEALNSNKLHHAWIFSGPKGIGKATLAYRLARRYLGAQPSGESPLSSIPSDKVCVEIANNSCSDLRTATRYCPEDEKIKSVISVHAIRSLSMMFDLKANNSSGRRVAIIDCADEMNDASANALLKTLEEPPKGALMILIVNSIGRLLPTIRSRCRILNLEPLNNAQMRFHLRDLDDATRIMANGCVGRAKVLKNFDINKNYEILSRALGQLPNPPLSAAIEFAKLATDAEKYEILTSMIDNWLTRAANASVGIDIEEIEPGESANMARIFGQIHAPKIFEIWQKLNVLKSQVGNQLDKQTAILEAINITKSVFAK